MSENTSTYDVIVVGGGAAGLSAALVLSRAQRTVAVVDAGEPRNAPAAHMHGFLSRDGMPPRDLLSAGRDEVSGYGGTVRHGQVRAVSRSGSTFDVVLADDSRLVARRLLVATGLRDELPAVPGLQARFGRDVLHCPYCHGYEVRDRKVGVLGGAENSLHQVQLVRQWADDVVFFAHRTELTAEQREQLVARAIGIVDGEVTGLEVHDGRLRGVAVEDLGVVERDAVFVAPRFVPSSDLLVQLGCRTDSSGWVLVDKTGLTSERGVWAAGNAVNPRAQVITAAGEGSAAAIAINNDLVEEDVRDAVVLFRHGNARATATGRSRGPRRYPPTTAGGAHMSSSTTPAAPVRVPPPSKHQLALMIWLAVFPTLTALNLAFGDRLSGMSTVLRTFVLATVAVPIVVYGVMPHLHRARAHLLSRS